MKDNLKDDILNACRGYERDHIMNTLKEIVSENSSQQLREMYKMNPCPKCGSTEVHITNVMQGVTQGRPKTVAKMGFCTACKFHSKKVYSRDMRNPYTEASWTIETVRVWNETKVLPFFAACEELFGEEYQYTCNSEEVLELIEALSRYGKLTARDRRFDRRQTDSSIISEMADVIICIFQLLHTRRVSPDVLNNVMREKINRTCQHESVRTAILGLSRSVDRMTHIVNVPAVEDDSVKP